MKTAALRQYCRNYADNLLYFWMRCAHTKLFLGCCLLVSLGVGAQQLPSQLLVDENFKNPPAGYYWVGTTPYIQAEMGAEGYTVRCGAKGGFVSQPVIPPGPLLDQDHDFVIEGELRGQGSVGLYWAGRNWAPGGELQVLQLNLGMAVPSVSVFELRAGNWTELSSNALPTAVAPADWHALRIVRSGQRMSYWLDGCAWPSSPFRPCAAVAWA